VQLIQEELAERDSHAAFEGLILPLLQDEVGQASMTGDATNSRICCNLYLK
jgi:hypothetical protein